MAFSSGLVLWTAAAAELRSRGLDAIGPLSFGRPVDLPGGGKAEARFNVFFWPPHQTPSGMGIFACQHLTRAAVWIPDLQTHANGAVCIKRVEVVSAHPKAAAERLSGLIDEPVSPAPDGWRVRSGGKRATFVFYDRAGFARRYPDAVRAGAAARERRRSSLARPILPQPPTRSDRSLSPMRTR